MYNTPWRTALSSQVTWDPIDGNASKEVPYDDWREAHGVRTNGSGDLSVFLNALVSNAFIMVAAILVFCIMRRLVPQVYSGNARKKEDGGRETAPFMPSSSFFGWVSAGLGVSTEEASKSSGLDAALVLEFTELSRNILITIGLPLVFVMCPLHYFIGGGRALRVGDRLSSIGLNNVDDGSWLFWIHAFVVWYVVISAEELIFDSMARFLDYRFKWLLDFKPPQALTILVENIPLGYRSDAALKSLFSTLFPESVESAYLVKNTWKLKPLVEELKAKRLRHEILAYKRDNKTRNGGLEPKEEKELEDLTVDVQQLRVQAEAERARIFRVSANPGSIERSGSNNNSDRRISQALRPNAMRSVATSSGFVTFTSQRYALIALHTRCTADMDEFVMSIPPQPEDMIYEDLQVPKFQQRIWTFLGGAMIFLLFWFFLPIVMIISSFTNLEAMEQHSEFIREVLANYPACHRMLDGVLSTLALVLMMSFLPTLLMLIFNNFFNLKAYAWAQLKLQRFYFAFLVTYVLFTTAIGSSIMNRVLAIFDHPVNIFIILSEALPTATNFYLDLLLVQTMQHAVNLTRYVQVAKYWSFRALLGSQRAIELSEPEDQDYYGIGARSARLSLDLVIGLVFCSLCPLMTVVCLVNFLVSRLTYGYLLVFAETKKHDLGGPFFVQQLWQVQFGLMLYAVLMCSVLGRRADHWGPMAIASGAIIYLIYSMWRFQHAFLWENLPMVDICDEENMSKSNSKMDAFRVSCHGHPAYMQPELFEELDEPDAKAAPHEEATVASDG